MLGTYKGEVKGSIIHGRGELENEKESYKGEFIEGNKEGNGVIEWKQGGDRYEGQFVNNLPHGQGNYFFASGDRYVGTMRKGAAHGAGTLTTASGDIFEGNFRQGKKHGAGVMYYSDGATFQATFREGKPNGFGQATYPDGEIASFECTFENGVPNGLGCEFYRIGGSMKGYFKEGRKTGTHYLVTPDDERWKIKFENGEEKKRKRLLPENVQALVICSPTRTPEIDGVKIEGRVQSGSASSSSNGGSGTGMTRSASLTMNGNGKSSGSPASFAPSSPALASGGLQDLAAVHRLLAAEGIKLHSTLYGEKDLPRYKALESISAFFFSEERNAHAHGKSESPSASGPEVYLIYYSGLSQSKTGNWIFSDGIIGLKDILDKWKIIVASRPKAKLVIVCDCSSSGAWIRQLEKHAASIKNVLVQASCADGEYAYESYLEGGSFTKRWINVSMGGDPSCFAFPAPSPSSASPAISPAINASSASPQVKEKLQSKKKSPKKPSQEDEITIEMEGSPVVSALSPDVDTPSSPEKNAIEEEVVVEKQEEIKNAFNGGHTPIVAMASPYQESPGISSSSSSTSLLSNGSNGSARAESRAKHYGQTSLVACTWKTIPSGINVIARGLSVVHQGMMVV